MMTLVLVSSLCGAVAHAQEDMNEKIEAYKKSLQADQRRRETVVKGNDLDWSDLVEGTPRVVSFSVKSRPDLALSGPYFGYMFSKNIEVGLDSEFYYDSKTVANKDKTVKTVINEQGYFFGVRFTVMAPLSPRFTLLASVSPGLFGGLNQTKTAATDDKTSFGPGFSLRVMPIGFGWRVNQLEFRTGMFLQYNTASASLNGADGTYKQFSFEHASGMIEVRRYF